MNIKEELMKELKESMQQKDTLRKDTVTMLRAAILKVEKDTQKELKLEEMQAIVAKEIKNRKESIAEFEKGAREDLIEKTKKEIEILAKYLPEQLTNEEILALIKNAIESVGATSMKDMGKVMAAIKTAVSGKADGKLVSDLVREELSKL
jgi:uncharacterized protein YqeY